MAAKTIKMPKQQGNLKKQRKGKWVSKEWWFGIHIGGKRRWFKGYSDAQLTRKLRDQLRLQIERRAEGLPVQAMGASPLLRQALERLEFVPRRQDQTLAKLVDRFAIDLLKESSPDYVAETKSRLASVLTGCRMVALGDLDWKKADEFVENLTYKKGEIVKKQAASTRGYYIGVLKQFGEWLENQELVEVNPLRKLVRPEKKGKEVIHRRVLSWAEVTRFLNATATRKSRTNLSNQDRVWIYLIAMSTGFRAEECSWLTPEHFDFDGKFIKLQVSAKSNNKALQPIHPMLLEQLRAYVASKPAGQPLWPGKWWRRAAETLVRPDLKAAGIPYIVNGEQADFHAIRHSFTVHLRREGVDAAVLQKLARHSTITLTMDVYGAHVVHSESAEAVAKLPLPVIPTFEVAQDSLG